MVLVVSVKLFGFIRAIARYGERLLSHKTTFTMLRDVRVQFLEKLIPRVPNLYRQYSSADLLTKMISKVEAFTKHLFKSLLSTGCHWFHSNYCSSNIGIF